MRYLETMALYGILGSVEQFLQAIRHERYNLITEMACAVETLQRSNVYEDTVCECHHRLTSDSNNECASQLRKTSFCV